MSSVTVRCKSVKQPRGGYIKPSQFKEVVYDDGQELFDENVHYSVRGMAVEYLTRFMSGMPAAEAFANPICGYSVRISYFGEQKEAEDREKKVDIGSLIGAIKGLDDASIVAACKAVTYDVWFRVSPEEAEICKSADETTPDGNTIHNIRVLVERCLAFFAQYGPVVGSGLYFPGGYTKTVDSGDADFMTADTLWDFKVSKSKPDNKQTLQLLMYWLMSRRSYPQYQDIRRLGIFNPMLNTVYLLETKDIPPETVEAVERDVIGY